MPQLRFNGNIVGGALVPYVGPNGNWWVGSTDTGTSANFAGGVYVPVKGVDYFTEDEIKEILDKADATTIMKTIISNIGNMEELSDESAESLVEAINNYAEALRQLQIQLIQINNYMVNNHMSVESIHMPTYYSTEDFDKTMEGPVVWNKIISSYPLEEIEDTETEDIETYELEEETADNIDNDTIYGVNSENEYVQVLNISEYSEGDDVDSIEEGRVVAQLDTETI